MSDEINKNLVFLAENLTSVQIILLHLIENDIITFQERELIMAERTTFHQNVKLLLTIEKTDWTRARNLFLQILRKTNNGHCADKIEGMNSEIIEKKEDLNNAKTLKDKWWPAKSALTKPFHLQNLGSELLTELHNRILRNENQMVSITESAATWKCFPKGGAGKTLLAKWYADTYEGYYDHILWIDCREDSLLKCFQKLARDLKVEDSNELQNAEDQATKIYHKLAEWKCLWVFDNIQNIHEIIRALPQYKQNFCCLMTSRREGAEKWGHLVISEFYLDIVSNKKNFKFINERLATKTTKFNYAVSLHNNGRIMECLKILDELYTRRPTQDNNFTQAVESIFTSLDKNQFGLSKIHFSDFTREATEMDIGYLSINCYLCLGNYDEALRLAKQIVSDSDIGQLMKILAVTQIHRYHLKVDEDKINLKLDAETNKIELSNCSLSFHSFDRLTLDEMTLSEVSFFREGEELEEVKVNDFLHLTTIKRLTLKCYYNMSIELSGDASMDYLQLENVRVLNWNNCSWKVKELELWYIPFVRKTNMQLQKLVINFSSLDVSCLPLTIQKLVLHDTKIFATEGIELPNLTHLTLQLISDARCFSHFNLVSLTRIHLINIKELNVDLLPQSLTHLKITNLVVNDTRFIGGLRKVDDLILNYLSFKRVQECLRHLQTDNLALHCYKQPASIALGLPSPSSHFEQREYQISSLSTFHRLSLEKLSSDRITDGFVNVTNMKRLALICSLTNIMSIELNGDVSIDYLRLENVRVLNWKDCKWDVRELDLISVPFLEKTNMRVQQLTLSNSSLYVSCLTPTIQKITLNSSKVFLSGEIHDMAPKTEQLTNKNDDVAETVFHQFKKDSTKTKLLEARDSSSAEFIIKTIKFNEAIILVRNGHFQECINTLEKYFTRNQTNANEQLTGCLRILIDYWRKNEMNIIFLDLEKDATQIDIGYLLLYCYTRLGNFTVALLTAKEFVSDVGHLLKILTGTQIPNYHLEVKGDKVDLNLDAKTKKIELRGCSLSLCSFERLSPEELDLWNMSFIRDGKDLDEVKVNDFLDLTYIKRLTLFCVKDRKNMTIDLSGDGSMEYLDLNNVQVLNWNNCNWNVNQLKLSYIPFVEETDMKVQEMIIENSSLDVSCLTQTIEKLTSYKTEDVFTSGEIQLPNLKLRYLKLHGMNDISSLSHFRSAPLTHIHLHLKDIKELNVDLLPQSVSHLQVAKLNANIRIVGGVRKMDKLILDYFSFIQVEECLSHIQTDNLVIYYPIKAKEMLQLTNKKINIIAVGVIRWDKDFKICARLLDRQADYYFLEGGTGRAIQWKEFNELHQLL